MWKRRWSAPRSSKSCSPTPCARNQWGGMGHQVGGLVQAHLSALLMSLPPTLRSLPTRSFLHVCMPCMFGLSQHFHVLHVLRSEKCHLVWHAHHSVSGYADSATRVCNTRSNRAMISRSFSSSSSLKQCMRRRRAIGQGGAGGSGRTKGGQTCPRWSSWKLDFLPRLTKLPPLHSSRLMCVSCVDSSRLTCESACSNAQTLKRAAAEVRVACSVDQEWL